MAAEVVVVHANEEPPPWWDAAVFLAGPLPRSADVPSWGPEAVALLRDRWRRTGRLVVFTPELREGVLADYTGQVAWEHRSLNWADTIVFWVPRDLVTMPAFTTNIEFGTWYDTGKVVLGAPPDAPKNEYLQELAASAGAPVTATLGGAVDAALDMVGTGARRTGGERSVPLMVWRTESFQSWYGAQRRARNELLDARVEWTFRVGPGRAFVLYWALHVQVHVAAEGRVKSNEVVISRPDTSQVVLYHRGAALDDTTVVLVREFRSPAATSDGFVRELPGGSSADGIAPVVRAVDEVREETGFVIGADRLRPVGVRQVAATVTAHRAHVFAAAITFDELAWFRARQGTSHGADESERTWIEISTYGELLADARVDWSTLGMIARAVSPRTHTMRLAPPYFAALIAGRKRTELRVLDSKRSQVQPGDRITFTCGKERAAVTVIDVRVYDSFADLYQVEDPNAINPDMTAADQLAGVRKIYPPEKEALGAVAIAVELCDTSKQ